MLTDKIRADLVEAIKSRNEMKSTTLRMLLSSLNYYKIEKQKENLSDEDVVSVVQKEAKKHNESIEMFKKGNRNDLVEKETAELEILKQYMPDSLSQTELENIITESIKETGASSRADFGKVMKAVMPKVRGRADGSQVSEVVKKKLS